MAEQKIIDVEPRHLKMINSIFARNLPFKKVWAFGSRVKFTARPSSDLDCVVFGATDSEIHKAQEAFDESEVPFEVQILNWETIPEDFKENIKKEYFVVRKESDWGEFKLGDICKEISYGYTTSATNKNTGIKFLRITDIVKPYIDWESVPYCKVSDKDKKKYQLMSGDIVIARTGATTGYAKRIKEDVKAVFASYLVRLRLHEDFDDKFIGYIVESSEYKNFIQKNIGGAAQPNANAQVLTSFRFLIPQSRKTQQKIASILSAYDDLIENNNRRIKILEEMAQGLYKEWFVNFKFPNHQNTKFVESELGKIPEGWEVGKIGDINSVNGGYAFKSNDLKDCGNISVIKIKNIQSGIIDISSTDYIEENVAKKACRFELFAGDILIAMTGAQVGKVGFVPRTRNRLFLNQRVGKFTPNKTYIKNNQFIAQFLKTDNFQSQINNTAQGAAQPNISSSQIEGIKLLIPNEKLIISYEDFVDSSTKEIELLVDKNQNLRQTRDLLLPRLISGEVSVENLKIEI